MRGGPPVQERRRAARTGSRAARRSLRAGSRSRRATSLERAGGRLEQRVVAVPAAPCRSGARRRRRVSAPLIRWRVLFEAGPDAAARRRRPAARRLDPVARRLDLGDRLEAGRAQRLAVGRSAAGTSASVARTSTPWPASHSGERPRREPRPRRVLVRRDDRSARDVGARAADQRERPEQDERRVLVVEHEVERPPAERARCSAQARD